MYKINSPKKYAKPVCYLNDGVDRVKLKQAINRRGKNQTQLAVALGKDNAFISNKLTGRAPFKVSDIQFFKEYLNLSVIEATDIFFGEKS